MDQIPPPILWIFATMTTIGLAVVGHVYRQISDLRDRIEHASSAELKEVWAELTGLRKELAADRQIASDSRLRLAETVVTRDELDRQLTRMTASIVAELDRHNRLVTGKGLRSDND